MAAAPKKAIACVAVRLSSPSPRRFCSSRAGARHHQPADPVCVALREKGFYRGLIDGIAGPMTAQAVRSSARRTSRLTGSPARKRGARSGSSAGRCGASARCWRAGWSAGTCRFSNSSSPGATSGPASSTAASPTAPRAPCAGCSARRTRSTASSAPRLAAFQKAGSDEARRPAPGRPVQHSLKRGALLRSVIATRARACVDGVRIPLERKVVGRRLGSAPGDAGTWRYVENFIIAHNVPRTLDGGVRVGVALHQLCTNSASTSARRSAPTIRRPWVRRHGLYPETRQFVRNVLALRSRFSSV